MAASLVNHGSKPKPTIDNKLVFIKLVPSGANENRVLEAAYCIYDVCTRGRVTKSFLFHHAKAHGVHEDTLSDHHTAPTEPDGRSLLQLVQDKDRAKDTMQGFCEVFSEDLKTVSSTFVTFVGDHIWQTRSLLYPFLFCRTPWIHFGRRRPVVHFVEYRTFLQPFVAMHAQMNEPFESPRWTFRAFEDVNAQTNFFDNMVQLALRRNPMDTYEPYCRPKCEEEEEDGEDVPEGDTHADARTGTCGHCP